MYRAYGCGQRFAGDHISQAPAGYSKTFAQPTHRYSPLNQPVQTTGRDVLAAVIEDSVIDLVGDQDEIMPVGEFDERSYFVAIEDPTGRIVGCIRSRARVRSVTAASRRSASIR